MRDIPFSAVLVDFFHHLDRDFNFNFNFNMTSSLSSSAMIKVSAGRVLKDGEKKEGCRVNEERREGVLKECSKRDYGCIF